MPDHLVRRHGQKAAAIVALSAGLGYLMLSGATVATQRAFVMMAVAFTAVLLDRPAISLRGLALAAAVVLAIRPVSLTDVGFQMSFAATAALVAGYEEVRRRRQIRRAAMEEHRRTVGRWRRVAKFAGLYLGGLVFTSLIAGVATAPYSAYHFNRAAPFGLPANRAAVPVMGLVFVPAAIAAGVLSPVGLSRPPLWLMGEGIEWVLIAAHRISDLPGSVRPVPVGPTVILPLMTLGGLWLFLWRGRWRLAGLAGRG
jgi:competence protein ComEC